MLPSQSRHSTGREAALSVLPSSAAGFCTGACVMPMSSAAIKTAERIMIFFLTVLMNDPAFAKVRSYRSSSILLPEGSYG